MITVEHAAAIFQVESVVALFLVVLLLLYAALILKREKDTQEKLREGRRHLMVLLDSEAPIALADLAPLRGFALPMQARLLAEVVPSLAGTGRERLAQVGQALGVAEHGWRLARSRFWTRRLQAVRLLSLVENDPMHVVAFLHDSEPTVREEALDWIADHPTRQSVEALLPLLQDPAPSVRFGAQDGLERAGQVLVEPLLAYLGTAQGTCLEKALRLAASSPTPLFLPMAMEHAQAEAWEIRVAALALLRTIGGEQATPVLEKALADPIPKVRAQAAAALGVLRHWTSAAPVAVLLEDNAWNVRRSAAYALRLMGPPGVLFLRRAGRREGQGRDIALHVMDLPEALARVEAPR